MMNRFERILMLTVHIILPKQTNFEIIRAFENLAFLIMSTRENIRLIARASFTAQQNVHKDFKKFILLNRLEFSLRIW